MALPPDEGCEGDNKEPPSSFLRIFPRPVCDPFASLEIDDKKKEAADELAALIGKKNFFFTIEPPVSQYPWSHFRISSTD